MGRQSAQSGRRQGKLRARPAYRGKWKTIFQNRKAKRSQIGKQTVNGLATWLCTHSPMSFDRFDCSTAMQNGDKPAPTDCFRVTTIDVKGLRDMAILIMYALIMHHIFRVGNWQYNCTDLHCIFNVDVRHVWTLYNHGEARNVQSRCFKELFHLGTQVPWQSKRDGV